MRRSLPDSLRAYVLLPLPGRLAWGMQRTASSPLHMSRRRELRRALSPLPRIRCHYKRRESRLMPRSRRKTGGESRRKDKRTTKERRYGESMIAEDFVSIASRSLAPLKSPFSEDVRASFPFTCSGVGIMDVAISPRKRRLPFSSVH
ncbi:hypothetical protein KC327_g60 [Hortaea werneckii]|nr:hypothetical protein KC327_g60 [Hortaea werneckii]